MPEIHLKADGRERITSLARTIFRYRSLVAALVGRDLKTRYKGSILGFLWSFANPLMMLGIYILVFGVYMRIDAPNYPAFLISGLFPWACFSLSVQSGTNSIIEGASYITQAVFPSEILPVIKITSDLTNFLLSIPIMLSVLLVLGMPLGWPLLALPLALAVQFVFTLGIVYFLATYNVFFRDVSYLVTNLLSLLFFAVPIIYPPGMVPPKLIAVVKWNPLARIIGAYQDIFYFNRFPNWTALAWIGLFSVILVLFSHWLFQRNKESFAEFL